MKNSFKLLYFSYKEISKLVPKVINYSIIMGIFEALLPSFSVYSLSYITRVLERSISFDYSCIVVIIFSLINFILYTSEKIIRKKYVNKTCILVDKEKEKIINSLYNIEYQKLVDENFNDIVYSYKTNLERAWSALVKLIWAINDWSRSILLIIISIILLRPIVVSIQGAKKDFLLYSISLVIVSFVSFCFIYIITNIQSEKNIKYKNEYNNISKMFSYYKDSLSKYSNGKDIRIFNMENIINTKTSQVLFNDGVSILKKASINDASSNAYITIIVSITGFAIYLFIALLGLREAIETSEIILYIGIFFQIVVAVSSLIESFGKVRISLDTMNNYFIITAANDNKQKLETNINDKITIELKNVSFSYGQKKVLDNINLQIISGEKIALVGVNGSGKTTLIKLLCGLLVPSSGDITINGISIYKMSSVDKKKYISAIFQDHYIYPFTIFENIALREEIGNQYEEIKHSLEQAEIDEFVKKCSEKEKTILFKYLNENGFEISGGESQKISLARAIQQHSKVLILDEPTAALDAYAEFNIYENLNNNTPSDILILISHRLSSCRFCDKIIVINEGKIVQEGSHNDLINNTDGLYYKLWSTQAENYKLN